MKAGRVGIAFDLDGTLLDYKARYHATFRDALKQYCISCPDAEFLFKTRRQTGSTREVLTRILKKADKELDIINECLTKREATIENWRYLKMDRCFSGVKDTLKRLRSQGVVLSVITLRKNRTFALKSLEKECLLNFFDAVLTRNDSSGEDSKVSLLKSFIDNFSLCECFYVGDSVNDIKDGKRAGVKTIAVVTGVDGKRIIMGENPDFVIGNVSELSKLIMKCW